MYLFITKGKNETCTTINIGSIDDGSNIKNKLFDCCAYAKKLLFFYNLGPGKLLNNLYVAALVLAKGEIANSDLFNR